MRPCFADMIARAYLDRFGRHRRNAQNALKAMTTTIDAVASCMSRPLAVFAVGKRFDCVKPALIRC